MPKLSSLLSRSRRSQMTVGEVVALIEGAYQQGWWDGTHAKDPRVSVRTKAQGLQRHMDRTANALLK